MRVARLLLAGLALLLVLASPVSASLSTTASGDSDEALLLRMVSRWERGSVAPAPNELAVLFELQPLDHPENDVGRLPLSSEELQSLLTSQLSQPIAWVLAADDPVTGKAAVVVTAADAYPEAVYLYGTLYARGYLEGSLIHEGFQPVRLTIAEGEGGEQVLAALEVESIPGRPTVRVSGPHPLWTDDAFGSADGELERLLGPRSSDSIFPDVPSGHPYGEAIQALASRGIVSGRTDGTFGPEEAVRRAQFAKMISETCAVPVQEDDQLAPFTDLGPDATDNLYPHEYVAAAYFGGITTGKTATTFEPYVDISRAQVITMVVRAIDQAYPGGLDEPPVPFTGTWGNFSATHADNAQKAEWNQLLVGLGRDYPDEEGDLARLDPWGKMPRGEVAQVLFNILPFFGDGIPMEEADVTRVPLAIDVIQRAPNRYVAELMARRGRRSR